MERNSTTQLGKRKTFRTIRYWIPRIVNHIHYVHAKFHKNREKAAEHVVSILLHVLGKHSFRNVRNLGTAMREVEGREEEKAIKQVEKSEHSGPHLQAHIETQSQAIAREENGEPHGQKVEGMGGFEECTDSSRLLGSLPKSFSSQDDK